MRFATWLAAGMAICVMGASARANSVLNGSFEIPIAPGGYLPLSAGNPALAPWVIASGNVEILANTYWQAADGNQSLDMNGTHLPGSIYQDLVTVPGQAYLLSFALAGNPDGPPIIKTLEVKWDGAVVTNATADITGFNHSNMGYQTHNFTVVASGPLTRLQFTSLDAGPPGPYGAVLDNVSVVAVPLPGAAMAGLALIGGTGLTRLRRNRLALVD